MRDVLAPVPDFTRKPAALRLRCQHARTNGSGGATFLSVFSHFLHTIVARIVTRNHHVRTSRRVSTMSIVHLQNVEIINSEARFSGA